MGLGLEMKTSGRSAAHRPVGCAMGLGAKFKQPKHKLSSLPGGAHGSGSGVQIVALGPEDPET